MADRIIYTFKNFLSERFPFEVRKIPVHTYLGCPHRNKSTGEGGCVYCYNPSFSTLSPRKRKDVLDQLQTGITRARQRGFKGKFIAYFQTDTNTFAHWQKLKDWWQTIFAFPEDIVGLAVSTRPDCLSPEVLQILNDIGKERMVWLELGLQSAHDRTLKRINRGHDYACFVEAVEQVHNFKNILVAAHIILGLPGESLGDMLYTIDELNRLRLHGVKFHHLQVVRNTVLAEWYARGEVSVFDVDEYLEVLITLLPELSPSMVVLRLIGDVYEPYLIAPRWPIPKTQVIQLLLRRMKEQNLTQGCRCNL